MIAPEPVASDRDRSAAVKGRFYGIGLGPGDPDLLTRRAHRLLRASSRILCPSTEASGPGRAAAVVRGLEDLSAEVIPYPIDVHGSSSTRRRQYERAAAEAIEALRTEAVVSAVTLGDPSLYSTLSRLLDVMKERLPRDRIEVVPGVASPQAAACLDGRPLAQGDQDVTLLPATASAERLSEGLDAADTLVVLKPRRRFEQLYSMLAGRDALTRSVLVEKAGWEEERVRPLEEVPPGDTPPYFSLVVVYPASP